jgi:membrane protease YdiL (CAAX protease family)
MAAAGLPPVWAMYAAVLLVLAPTELTLIRRLRGSRDEIDTRWPRPRRLMLLLTPTLAAAALAPGLVQWLEPGLHAALHLPPWWQLDPMLSDPARPAWQSAVTVTGWLLCFVVVGPVVEELYFRGLLQRSAIRRLGPIAGIVLPALAFGLVHTSTDLSGWSLAALVTALAAFGAVLGVLAHRTGRLGPGLVAHATFNALTLIALALS